VVSSLQDFKQSTIVSYLIFVPLLPDLTILIFGEAQAHTHNFYLGRGLLALRLYTKFMWVRSVHMLCVLYHHENLVQIIYLYFIL